MPTGFSLDELALAALGARMGRVDSSQVNKLVEVLDAERDVSVLLAFLARQVGRGLWGDRVSASRLYRILTSVGSVEEARRALGMFKWLFEAAGKDRVSRGVFDLANKVRDSLRNPRSPAPSGFFRSYIEAALS